MHVTWKQKHGCRGEEGNIKGEKERMGGESPEGKQSIMKLPVTLVIFMTVIKKILILTEGFRQMKSDMNLNGIPIICVLWKVFCHICRNLPSSSPTSLHSNIGGKTELPIVKLQATL